MCNQVSPLIKDNPIKMHSLISQKYKFLYYILGFAIEMRTEDKVVVQRLKSFNSKL